MKSQFDIQSSRSAGTPYTLALEIGPDHYAYAFFDKAGQSIDRLFYSTFDERQATDLLEGELSKIRELTFERVLIASSFPQALLVPKKFFHEDHTFLDVVFNYPGQNYFHDVISEWNLVVAYSLPRHVAEIFKKSFHSPDFFHSNTAAIKIYNGSMAQNQLSVDFSSQYFRVLVKSDQQILLIQTYQYKTPLDVVYFLLKICYEFNLDQTDVHLILSGLLEKDSSLYHELQNYFLHVHFVQAPGFRLPEKEHPQHFFTSLYNLAACAS